MTVRRELRLRLRKPESGNQPQDERRGWKTAITVISDLLRIHKKEKKLNDFDVIAENQENSMPNRKRYGKMSLNNVY